MKSYVLNIIIAAILVSITGSAFDPKKANGKIIRILSGILLTTTILSPFKNISFRGISDWLNDISLDANAYVYEGKITANEQTSAIIKEYTEAYILDKAKNMGLDISVEVELSENDSVPCGITLSGEISPYEKSVLCDYLEDTLGITRENQKWK